MEVFRLDKAAEFLSMNPEVLRRKAKKGEIPGRKAGKCWVFIKEHLADWVSGRYPEDGRNLRLIDGGKQEDKKPCQSIKEKAGSGGLPSQIQVRRRYKNLLEPK